jgi:hypothetical protein
LKKAPEIIAIVKIVSNKILDDTVEPDMRTIASMIKIMMKKAYANQTPCFLRKSGG